MQTYVVGGAVRDELLGIPVMDRDYVVVGATPEEMIAKGFKPVGADFPVFLHPETHDEYALARTERKTAPGYRGFVFHADPGVTLEQDLLRRDLTINAMAQDSNGNLIDPFGGEADLRAGVLRHVSPAFAEDPVRILRLARFAARFGFRVAAKTLALMQDMAQNGEVDALVPERIWQELSRGLMEQTPSRMFEVLRDCGALARILPEIDRLFGVPQAPNPNLHPEVDTGVHVMMVVDHAARRGFSLAVRFAALTLDLGKGKGETPREHWPRDLKPGTAGHEGKSVDPVKAMCDRIKAPSDCRDLAVISARWHGHAHRSEELTSDTLLELFEGTDALRRPERFVDFLNACAADHHGRNGFEDVPYPQMEFLRAALTILRGLDYRDITESGTDISLRIRQRRLEALQEFVNDKAR